LAANPIPIIIPCHRVVAGNGRLTGFSAPGGVKLKKNLLQMEGVEFKGELICQVK
jgi:methylated-DNA-[protein]-cysteine S-methyltransferase